MSNSNKLLNIFFFSKKRYITKIFIICTNRIFCYDIKKLYFLKYKIVNFIVIPKYRSNNIKIIHFKDVIYKNLYNKKNHV